MTKREFNRRLDAYDPSRHGNARDYLWKLMLENLLEAQMLLYSIYGMPN